MCFNVYFQCEKCGTEFRDPEKNVITCDEKSDKRDEAAKKATEQGQEPPPMEYCPPEDRQDVLDVQDTQKSADCDDCKERTEENKTDHYPSGSSEDSGGP